MDLGQSEIDGFMTVTVKLIADILRQQTNFKFKIEVNMLTASC